MDVCPDFRYADDTERLEIKTLALLNAISAGKKLTRLEI